MELMRLDSQTVIVYFVLRYEHAKCELCSQPRRAECVRGQSIDSVNGEGVIAGRGVVTRKVLHGARPAQDPTTAGSNGMSCGHSTVNPGGPRSAASQI